MKISVNVVLATNETIRIIYPSKEIIHDGLRTLSSHAVSRWYGQLSSDLNNETFLADLIKKQNNEIFSSSSNTVRKIQAIDENLKLSEFFIGGQILLISDQNRLLSDRMYLPDRDSPLEYLGDYLLSEILKQINKLDLMQYDDNTILLAVNVI